MIVSEAEKFVKFQPLDEQVPPPPQEHGKFGAIDPKDHIGQEKVSQAPCPNVDEKDVTFCKKTLVVT